MTGAESCWQCAAEGPLLWLFTYRIGDSGAAGHAQPTDEDVLRNGLGTLRRLLPCPLCCCITGAHAQLCSSRCMLRLLGFHQAVDPGTAVGDGDDGDQRLIQQKGDRAAMTAVLAQNTLVLY